MCVNTSFFGTYPLGTRAVLKRAVSSRRLARNCADDAAITSHDNDRRACSPMTSRKGDTAAAWKYKRWKHRHKVWRYINRYSPHVYASRWPGCYHWARPDGLEKGRYRLMVTLWYEVRQQERTIPYLKLNKIRAPNKWHLLHCNNIRAFKKLLG